MTISHARRLRGNLTRAERLLWSRLRRNQLDGFYFRRQVPIGSFIVDFLCEERGLIIELDGGQHAKQAGHDARRTSFLEDRGDRVIRFWNGEVLENPDGVLETILSALLAPPE